MDDVVASVIDELVQRYQDAETLNEKEEDKIERLGKGGTMELIDDNENDQGIQHMIDRLSPPSSNILLQLILAYQSQIRPAILRFSSTEDQLVSVQNGLVGQRYLELIQQYGRATSTSAISVVRDDDSIKEKSQIWEVIASDITLLSSSTTVGDRRALERQTPITLLWTLLQFGAKYSFWNNSTTDREKIEKRCICSLLAFGEKPMCIQGGLAEHLELSCWAVSPCEQKDAIEAMLQEASSHPMDWKKFQTEPTLFVNEKALAVTRAVWIELFQNNEGTERQVLQRLGWPSMAIAMRSHFFGRDVVVGDSSSQQVAKRPEYRLQFGHYVPIDREKELEEKATNLMNQRPYQKVPARLYAVVRFMSLLEPGDVEPVDSNPFLDEMLPICFELLNGNDDATIGKGAAILAQLMFLTDAKAWKVHGDNVLAALDSVATTCRDGCAVALTGLAQSTLINILTSHHEKNDKYQMVRRKATQHWVLLLDRIRHNPTDAKLAWGILVTLIRLLRDHTQQENADGLELGRPGLKCFLPLIRLSHEVDISGHCKQVPTMALVALANLLVAAHPVMNRHRNKVMCELLACLGHSNDDSFRALATHVAAVAFVVCAVDTAAAAPFLDEGLKKLRPYVDEVETLAKKLVPKRATTCDP